MSRRALPSGALKVRPSPFVGGGLDRQSAGTSAVVPKRGL